MANPEHYEIIKQGVEMWNLWRQGHPEIEPDLANSDLSNMKLKGANFNNTDLRGADLRNADFRGSTLIRADLRAGNIGRASFNLAKLSEANFSEAFLKETDLSEADLNRAYFIRSDLVRVDLWESNLKKADFRWSYLIGSDLKRADLHRADLRWAYLSEVNLREADLSGADLIKASIIKTDLTQSNFNETAMGWTYFGDVDLSQINALNTVRHYGPSSIGIDTLYRSKGRISETLLREAGVPENFIQNMGWLSKKTSEYQNCFISYANKDHEFAVKLCTDLKNKGVRCWYAGEDMKIGDKDWISIYHFIRMRDKVLLILSENSITSDWVEDEVNTALEEESQQKAAILFPICIDSAVIKSGQASAEYVHRLRNICDFTGWKNHDAYQTALAKLLDDLQTAPN